MLPLCDTSLSGIREDKQPDYYYEVRKWSNIYANQIGLGGSYGHGFKHTKLTEYFPPVMDVLLGVVFEVEPVTQFIASGIWVMTQMITLHRG